MLAKCRCGHIIQKCRAGPPGADKVASVHSVSLNFLSSSCFQEPAFALTAGLIAARDLAAG